MSKKETVYKRFGMDTKNIVQGAMQIIVGAVFLVGLYFFIVFLDSCVMPKCFRQVKTFYATLKMKIFWNAVLRALIE